MPEHTVVGAVKESKLAYKLRKPSTTRGMKRNDSSAIDSSGSPDPVTLDFVSRKTPRQRAVGPGGTASTAGGAVKEGGRLIIIIPSLNPTPRATWISRQTLPLGGRVHFIRQQS